MKPEKEPGSIVVAVAGLFVGCSVCLISVFSNFIGSFFIYILFISFMFAYQLYVITAIILLFSKKIRSIIFNWLIVAFTMAAFLLIPSGLGEHQLTKYYQNNKDRFHRQIRIYEKDKMLPNSDGLYRKVEFYKRGEDYSITFYLHFTLRTLYTGVMYSSIDEPLVPKSWNLDAKKLDEHWYIISGDFEDRYH